MSSWVLSSNPATYDAQRAIKEKNEIDWVTKQDFNVGDIIYIYEVIPPRGRGGIVYKTKVTRTDLSLKNKFDDRKHWAGQVYPKSINAFTKFCRLSVLAESNSDSLSLESLKEYDFTPPQGLAHLLDKKPRLLNYIQNQFNR